MPSLTHLRRGVTTIVLVLVAVATIGCVRAPVDVTSLSPSDSITVTTDGAVIDRRDVRGQINVKANDVTIRNTRVVSDSYYPIRQFDGFTGLRVIDTDVRCTSDKGAAAVVFNQYRAERVHVNGCKKPFILNGDVVVSQSLWNGQPVANYPAGSTSTTKPPTTQAPTTQAPTTTRPAPNPTTTTAPPATQPPATQAPTTRPPATTPPATQPPATGGFPTAATTGVPAGTTLTPSGSLTVSTNGAVIDRVAVNGSITINADNVTIRRSRVTTSAALGIRVNGRNALIEDVDVVGTSVSCGAGIGYGNYTARRVDVSGCADGLKVAGNVLVEGSYIHDQRKGPGTHNDAVQASAGSHIVLRGNSLIGPHLDSNAALMFGTSLGPISDVLVERNFLSGGGYMVYFVNQDKGYGAPTNVRLLNNVIDAGSFKHNWLQTDTSIARSGNVYDTGGAAN